MITVIARLRLPDGREFDIVETVERPDGWRWYWTEGNNACDCNRKLYIDRQHGTQIDDGNCGETIALVSLTVGGLDALSPEYHDDGSDHDDGSQITLDSGG